MNSAKYIAVGLILAVQNTAQSHPEGTHDFCSGVRMMYNRCNAYENMQEQNNHVVFRGKTGPKGVKGEKGSDATIDYDALERMIEERLENATFELMQKYAELRLIVDRHSKEIYEVATDQKEKNITDCSQVHSTSLDTLRIYAGERRIDVSCDLSTDGGDWTVIQRRMDESENFLRNYTDYVKGFGRVSGEFWIGLDNLYSILQTAERFELRIDMEDWDGVKKFAKYSTFNIEGPDQDYRLAVAGYSGTATDSLLAHSGYMFSAMDHDSDHYFGNCAQIYKGAWWYNKCHVSNLNGLYDTNGPHGSFADGVNWHSWKGYYYSLKFVEMKIKPARD